MAGKASITSIRFENQTKGVTYKVFPEGEVPRADKGDIVVWYTEIINVGDTADYICFEEYVDTAHQPRICATKAAGGVVTWPSYWHFDVIWPPLDVVIIASHGKDVAVEDDRKTFTIQPYTTPTTCSLTIASTTGGTTSPAPGVYAHVVGDVVTVSAIPDSGYQFSNWILDGSTLTDNPVNVSMDKDHTLTAYFSAIPPPTVPEYTTAYQIPQPNSTVTAPFSHARILARHATGIQKIEFVTWRSGQPAVRVWLSKTGVQVVEGVEWEVWEGDLPTPQTVETNYTGYFDIYANDGSRKEYSFPYAITSVAPPQKHSLSIYAREYTTKMSLAVPFEINSASASTPYSAELDEGTYVVTMPAEVDVEGKHYRFKMWMEDGSTNPVKTVNLTADISFMAAYEEVAPPPATHALTISAKSGASQLSVPFTINGAEQLTPYTATLSEGAYTVAMPATIKIGEVDYNFKRWAEDGDVMPTKTINLTSDQSWTAEYEEVIAPPPAYTLVVNSEPQGIPFTIDTTSASTPFSQELPEADYTIKMPTAAEVGGVKYTFKQWQDGETSPTRTVHLGAAGLSLKAIYEAPPAIPWEIIIPLAVATAIGIGVAVWYYTSKKS